MRAKRNQLKSNELKVVGLYGKNKHMGVGGTIFTVVASHVVFVDPFTTAIKLVCMTTLITMHT